MCSFPSTTSRDLSDEQLRCKFLQQGEANPSPRALSLKGWSHGSGKSCLLGLSRSITKAAAEARLLLCFPNHWDLWPFHVAGCFARIKFICLAIFHTVRFFHMLEIYGLSPVDVGHLSTVTSQGLRGRNHWWPECSEIHQPLLHGFFC